MIDGVQVKLLKPIPDERGRVMEIFRIDDPFFERFGQMYITTVYSGVVKGWHFHRIQSDNMTCVVGMIKLVLYDSREQSPTKGAVMEQFVGVHRPALVHIPPLVYHGFKGVSEEEAMILNCPTEPYNPKAPDEYRVDPHSREIPYDWSRKDR